MMLQRKEYRSAEVYAGQDNRLVGVALPFGKRAHIESGGFYEIIDRHALDDCDLNDSTLRVEHMNGVPLARTPKTMQLTIEDDGLHMRAVLADTATAREVWKSVERRDLRGMSFGFKVAPGGSSYDPQTNTRTVTKIEHLYEVSLTANPCYAETSVEARSQIQGERERQDQRRQLMAEANQVILI